MGDVTDINSYKKSKDRKYASDLTYSENEVLGMLTEMLDLTPEMQQTVRRELYGEGTGIILPFKHFECK